MNQVIRKRTSPAGPRPGMILAAVMICVLVATLIVAGMLKAMASQHRQIRDAQRQWQAVWLAESAIERAAAKLRQSPDYQGETWSVPAELLGGTMAGSVVIRVEPVGDLPSRRRVRVQADFPDDPIDRIRHSRRVLIDLTEPGEQP